ncbi:hypothetical protein CHS0354_028055 [Potamilus streckersoni]|uniref:PLAT domain-containing protein n=1 Tax=Potamilus streckersoni TaxID=2493646 RepID=A0AAE0THX4_9BIVA|nr:hypothetical protein CHS0354_028055 [Potamilus streckersoni]
MLYRDVVNQPVNGVDDAPGMDPIKADVCMRVAGVQCMVRLDETWTDSICKVDPESSTMDSTTCRCTLVTVKNMYIGTTFDIPQALYEYNLITVAEIKSGFPYVYVPFVFVNIVFGIFMFLAWRSCTKEPNWWKCTFLIDNDIADSYFYIITVYTGFGSEAGTDSNVFFELCGDEGTSGIRSLKDECNKPLLSGTVLQYCMSFRTPIGEILALRIWHDNSGGKNWSWYLKRIIIDDPQIHKRLYNDTQSSAAANATTVIGNAIWIITSHLIIPNCNSIFAIVFPLPYGYNEVCMMLSLSSIFGFGSGIDTVFRCVVHTLVLELYDPSSCHHAMDNVFLPIFYMDAKRNSYLPRAGVCIIFPRFLKKFYIKQKYVNCLVSGGTVAHKMESSQKTMADVKVKSAIVLSIAANYHVYIIIKSDRSLTLDVLMEN